MRDGLEGADREAWSVLASQLGDGGNAVAPFQTFTELISMDMSGKELWEVYLCLYRRACQSVLKTEDKGEAPAEGEVLISYNIAMTSGTLTICPRVSEGSEIKKDDGTVVGKLALNGTVLAGTALVKSEEEWNVLRADEDKLRDLLESIGMPNDS